MMRYSSQYEERLDPFTSFSRKVKNRSTQSRVDCDPAGFSLLPGRKLLSKKRGIPGEGRKENPARSQYLWDWVADHFVIYCNGIDFKGLLSLSIFIL